MTAEQRGTPKAGEMFFHRETLTAVTVMAVQDDVAVAFDGILVSPFPIIPAWQFREDFARDEPLTHAVFDKLGGWRKDDRERYNENLQVFFDEAGNVIGMQAENYPLTTPRTLRELLNVLRVFGVGAKPGP